VLQRQGLVVTGIGWVRPHWLLSLQHLYFWQDGVHFRALPRCVHVVVGAQGPRETCAPSEIRLRDKTTRGSQDPGWLGLFPIPCPITLAVACGWSPWTPWSLCSHSCNVGIQRRFRAGTAPPAAFGGAECQGPNMEAEFCSLRPCQGKNGDPGPQTSLKNLPQRSQEYS
jgi:hypothetical protein